MSPTGILFSYAIGLIFLVGGVVFLLFLEDNRLLFGIPYLVLGLLLIAGVAASQRRRGAKAAAAEGGEEDEAPPDAG